MQRADDYFLSKNTKNEKLFLIYFLSKYTRNLKILHQLVVSPTRIPDADKHLPSLLNLFLITHPDGYQVLVRAALRNI